MLREKSILLTTPSKHYFRGKGDVVVLGCLRIPCYAFEKIIGYFKVVAGAGVLAEPVKLVGLFSRICCSTGSAS